MNTKYDNTTQEADKSARSSSDPFIHLLNDRDSIVGAFVGNPLARKVHWGGQQYDDCLGIDCPYCRIGQAAQFRVSINLFVPEKNEMKIIEGGERWFRDLLKVRNKYGLDKWFFEVERRHDTSKSWPRYSILPDRKISAAQLETIHSYKLHDLKAIFSRRDQTQCLDSEIVTEFTTRLNRLPSSDVAVFFQQLHVSNLGDIPATNESAARQLLGGLEAWARRRDGRAHKDTPTASVH